MNNLPTSIIDLQIKALVSTLTDLGLSKEIIVEIINRYTVTLANFIKEEIDKNNKKAN